MRSFIAMSIGLMLCGSSMAGFVGGTPWGIVTRPHKSAQRFVLEGRVLAVRWTSYTGRVVSVPLPRPLALDALVLSPPVGEWVEITLVFHGPPRLVAAQGDVELPLSQLTLPLMWPVSSEDGAIRLSLDLPELDSLHSDPDTLIHWLEDGTIAHAEPFPGGAH